MIAAYALYAFGAAVIAAVVYWLATSSYKPELYLDDSAKKKAREIKYPTYDLPRNCLVTGGSGFLGLHIVDCLLAQGCNVTVFDIVDRIDDKRVKVIVGDLVDKKSVLAAMKGIDLVFHVASPPPHLNNAKLFMDVNVTGTKNVLECCEAAGVRSMVFTSSASVVYAGTDQSGVDESIPYPKSYRDVYCKTKALAEQAVREFGKKAGGRVHTISLRPHGLFGERDPQLVPTLIDTARRGKTKFAIGTGQTVVDMTYVGNVVHSHMLAAQVAASGTAPQTNGEVYFITNDQPLSFWGFLSSILVGLGYPSPKRTLPYAPILFMSHIVQGIVTLLAPIKKMQITFSPSRIQLAGTHHWYSCKAAKRDLGYKPLWTVQEGLCRTLPTFRHLCNPNGPAIPVDVETPYTVADVAKHNKENDAWLIIDGLVYDITDYVDLHPGGDKILKHMGGDATEGFNGPQHPSHVFETVKRYRIGRLST